MTERGQGRPPAANNSEIWKIRLEERDEFLLNGIREIPLDLLAPDPETGAPPRELVDPVLLLEFELFAWGDGRAFYVLKRAGAGERNRAAEGPLSGAAERSTRLPASGASEVPIGAPGASEASFDVRYCYSGKPRPELTSTALRLSRLAIDRAEVFLARARVEAAGVVEALAAWATFAAGLLGSRRGPGATIEIPRDGTPFVLEAGPWERQRRLAALLAWIIVPLILISAGLVAWVEIMGRAFPGGL